MSARAEFLVSLRAGLRGAPAEAVDEIIADYATHFDEAAANNRDETGVASALGDPLALADELRMELRIELYESAPSARSAAKVVAGAVAFGVLNLMLLCVVGPVIALMALGGMLAVLTAAGVGIWFLFAGASLGLPGGAVTTVLCALGLLSASVSAAALLLLAAKIVIDLVARYARLHYRLLPFNSKTGKIP